MKVEKSSRQSGFVVGGAVMADLGCGKEMVGGEETYRRCEGGHML